MQLTLNEKTFLEMIKKTCIDYGVENRIVPSVIGSIGIIISSWGTSKEFFNTRNIYLLPVDNDWFGKCYSKDTETIYDKPESCKESGSILYRVYDDHKDSIKDFIYMLISSRRSKNGLLRYQSIIGCTEYKDTVDRLVRNGFMQNYLHRVDNVEYISTLIGIIEKYKLYEWDDSLKKEDNDMSKKKHHYDTQNSTSSNENVIKHIYRVRLDWDKRDTQIFSSPSYDDALEVARKHEGYKIYIDDDGELFEDPWAIVNTEKDTVDEGPKPIIHPLQGEIIVLNNAPVYQFAIAKYPMMVISGTFYFYDNTIINKRAKITVHKDLSKKDPSMILGYIDI